MSAARHHPALSGRRFLVTGIALLGLAFHALLPLSYNAMQRAMADAARAEGGIQQLVICTALGLRTVAVNNGQPGDADPSAPKKTGHGCPICLAAAGLVHILLPAGLLLALPAVIVSAVFQPADYRTPDRRVWLPARARAPPAFPS